MSYKAMRAVGCKHNFYQKYMNSDHPARVRVNKLASKAVKESRRNFEMKLAKNINVENEKKSFFLMHAAKPGVELKWGRCSMITAGLSQTRNGRHIR